MVRLALWAAGTLAAVILLLTFRTSTGGVPAVTPAAAAPGVYPGPVVRTRWGPVQVRVTVSGSTITAVDVPLYPDGTARDEKINRAALPQLRQRTLEAQSADIDAVSGATVTSDGYRSSLQGALDAAFPAA